MKLYPVTTHREVYRGADPKKRAMRVEYNRIAGKVDEYLNADLAEKSEGFCGSYMSYEVAAEIHEDSRIVQRIISRTDGGTTGITILKPVIRIP